MILLYVIAFVWLFWYVYIVVMGLYRAQLQDRLKGVVFALALPAIVAGYVMDIIANIFIASVLFLDPPKEFLVTTRLKRYQKVDPLSWRGRLSFYICEHLLDVFDPKGNHC